MSYLPFTDKERFKDSVFKWDWNLSSQTNYLFHILHLCMCALWCVCVNVWFDMCCVHAYSMMCVHMHMCHMMCACMCAIWCVCFHVCSMMICMHVCSMMCMCMCAVWWCVCICAVWCVCMFAVWHVCVHVCVSTQVWAPLCWCSEVDT